MTELKNCVSPDYEIEVERVDSDGDLWLLVESERVFASRADLEFLLGVLDKAEAGELE